MRRTLENFPGQQAPRGRLALSVRSPFGSGCIRGDVLCHFFRYLPPFDMRILFASHTHMRGVYVVGSHHLASALAEKGHEVVHFSSPITPFHLVRWWSDERVRERFRAWWEGMKTTAGGVYEGVPLSLMPGTVNLQFLPSTNVMIPLILPSLRSTLQRADIDRIDIAFIDQPAYFDLWKYVPIDTVIYRPTDVYATLHENPSIRCAERKILQSADGLVATSQPTLDALQPVIPSGLSHCTIPNGVDFHHFRTEVEPPEEYEAIPRPRAVYIGAIDERFDRALIRSAAQAQPGVHFVLIGRTSPGTKANEERQNLHVLGARPYHTLPAYLQHADVGLIPMNDHPANEGRSPMKIYEYMAAGLEVIARATSEMQKRDHDCLHLYNSPSEFLTEIRQALKRGERSDVCRSIAQERRWEKKGSELLDFARAVR